MLKFKNHRAVGVKYNAAKHMRGTIKPSLVVLHDTAGSLSPRSSARYLLDNPAKTSVHFVVERDGSFEQQVPINRGANHAGRSSYNGRDGCNDFSIGIEIVNPGRMTAINGTKSRAWFGTTFDNVEHGIVEVETPQHGRGLWMPHTPEQIATVVALCQGLFGKVKTLKDIQPHWYISPGRKVDTNPLFPLDNVRAIVLGREDNADGLDETKTPLPGEEWAQIDVRFGSLNMRRWPSFNPNIITRIPDETRVPVIRQGEFAGRQWSLVLYDGQEGWVVSNYLKFTGDRS